jgi:predicted aspartyl protease
MAGDGRGPAMQHKNIFVGMCGAVALLLLNGCANAPPTADCHLSILAQFPVTMTRRNAIFLPATIDGHKVEFLVDTGAFHSLLFDDALHRLGISFTVNAMAGRVEGIGGEAQIGEAYLKDLKLGDISFGAVVMSVIVPDREIEKAEAGEEKKEPVVVAGVIGGDFLHNYDLEFNLAENEAFLISQDHCPGQVQHWNGLLVKARFRVEDFSDRFEKAETYRDTDENPEQDYMIRVPIKANGQDAIAMLDSGSGSSYMTWRVAHALGVTKETPGVSKAGFTTGVDGHLVQAYRYLFPSFVIGDETIMNVPVEIGDIPATIDDDMANTFLLGADFLKRNRVYIAYGERMIYFTPYTFKYAADAPGK